MELQTFFTWFQLHNGYIDSFSMDVIQFPPSEGGRGAIALKDIPVSSLYFWRHPFIDVLKGRTCSLLGSSDTATVDADESAAIALWYRRVEELWAAQGLVWTYPLYDVGSCTRF